MKKIFLTILPAVILLSGATLFGANKNNLKCWPYQSELKLVAQQYGYSYMSRMKSLIFKAQPVGSIMAWPNPKLLPKNYVPCNGLQLPVKLFSDLHDILGDRFGSKDDHFNVPDMDVISCIGKPELLNDSKNTNYTSTAEQNLFVTLCSQNNNTNTLLDGYVFPDSKTDGNHYSVFSSAYGPECWGPISTSGLVSKGMEFSVFNAKANPQYFIVTAEPFLSALQDQSQSDTTQITTNVIYIIKVHA